MNKKLLALPLATFALASCGKEEEFTLDPFTEVDIVSSEFKNNVNTCYQIFPISFADSNGDGYGDINGITENISYLTDTLKVDCIWLNPIHESPSYHKYDVKDFYSVDPKFGTVDDMKNLINVAHDNDIKVLMDFVINHTSSEHEWFQKALDGDSKYRDFYTFEDKNGGDYNFAHGWNTVNGERYYSSFWSGMPELDFDNNYVKKEIFDIGEFWLDAGFDGFRIDAAKHIFDLNEDVIGTSVNEKNKEFFYELNMRMKNHKEDAVILLENWANAHSVSKLGQYVDSSFNFDLSDLIIDGVTNGFSRYFATDTQNMKAKLLSTNSQFIDAVFLSNHDRNRIMNEFGLDVNKGKLAASILMTMPGVSWIYYGEEIGMSGVKPDENIRQPFKWSNSSTYNVNASTAGIGTWDSHNSSLAGVEAQKLDNNSMLSRYSELTEFRRNNSDFALGTFVALSNNDNYSLVNFKIESTNDYYVLHNLGSSPITVTDNSYIGKTAVLNTHNSSFSSNTVTLQPYSSIVLK